MALKLADVYAEVARMHERGIPGVVATVIVADGSTPRSAGAKMIVYSDGRTLGSVGGGAVEAATIERALATMGSKDPVFVHFDLDEDTGMACGGEMAVFLEPVAPGPAVIVVGGGHVGKAVAEAAGLAGFRVTVVDDRADMVTPERFPSADRRLVGGIELLENEIAVDGSTYVVVVTRGHRFDAQWVEALADREPAYVGMIGSANKVRMTFDGMKERGLPREVLERIHAPIGLDIGAETPEEIAASVVAEMIAVKHGVTDTAMLKNKPEHKGQNRG